MIAAAVRPRGPYSLRDTLRAGSDATRTNVDHVAFGKVSPHPCLEGAPARMKNRLIHIELIPSLVSTDLNGEVTRVRSNFVNDIKTFLCGPTR